MSLIFIRPIRRRRRLAARCGLALAVLVLLAALVAAARHCH